MRAVRMAVLAALRRRRLQAFVISFVLFLSTGAATLAFAILAESDAPFDRAFAATNGAHLVITYSGATDPQVLAATAHAVPVTSAGGPWPAGRAGFLVGPPVPGGGRAFDPSADVSGRPDPAGGIDQVTIQSGRWWQAPGEIVLRPSPGLFGGLRVGDTIQVTQSAGTVKGGSAPGAGPVAQARTMTIVGFAQSVSTPDTLAWMSPQDIAALTPAGALPDLAMFYRVNPAGTADELQKDAELITSGLPAQAVHGTTSYLGTRDRVDQTANLMVPILLAFSAFALLAAAFAIVNIVSGVVLASYREIGVLKAVGFTPRQVTALLVAEVMAPVAAGSVAGVVAGTVGSQPVLSDTAHAFGLPAAFTASGPVVAGVLVLAVVAAMLSAVGPARRAGRLTVVTAMTRGTAPSGQVAVAGLRGAILRLRLADPVRLGIARGLSRPLRALMTFGALVVGVAALAFTFGMSASLRQVGQDVDRDHAAPIQIDAGPGGGDAAVAANVRSALAANADTWHVTAIADATITVPSLAAPIPYVAYDGDSSTLGYSLISGRWFSAPGEVVAPTNFLRETGLTVGSGFDATFDGRPVRLTIVGEIFDLAREARDGLLLRGTWATLAAVDPSVTPDRWEVAPRPGVDPAGYRDALREALGFGADVQLTQSADTDTGFLLFEGVVLLLGVVLLIVSVGGVFNTILLDARERVRETAILKAIGMTPRQVLVLVVSSIVPASMLAGLVGIPAGMLLQRAALDQMAAISAHTNLPPDVLDVFSAGPVLLVACSGLVIGALGALLPARRAARSAIAPMLQAE